MPQRTPGAAVLPRAIGRIALAGLFVNAVVGSSAFGLPSVIGGRLGAASPWAWLIAALGMAFIIACFAEVASRFSDAGGAYLYARVVFGRLAGIEMGWLGYLVRLTAAATNANLFVIYLGQFWPAATGPGMTPVILALVLGPLSLANYRGVATGLSVSSFFTIAKLLPLGLFIVAGLGLVLSGNVTPVTPATVVAGGGDWLNAVLLLVFAYGGFEAALMPLGEAKDPRRDAPFALFTALAVCIVIYTLAQVVVVWTLAEPGAHERPLADAAQVLVGPWGAWLLAVAALVSVYGYLAGAMLNVPRLTWAMAEQGDLPPAFAAPHPRFRTPYRSIVVFALLTWLLASAGSFLQNLSLSAVSRLLTYGGICLAMLVLRRRDRTLPGGGPPALLRIPAGPVVACAGIAFSLVLALRMTPGEAGVLLVALGLGLLHWWLMNRKKDSAG